MDPVWWQGNFTLDPPDKQNDIVLGWVTVEELQSGTGNLAACPKNLRRFSKHMLPGNTMYCFRFVKPGMPPGKLHDGLMYVNDHWVIFPKAPVFYQWGLAEAGLLDDDE
jgi:hypothetical protein